MQIIKYTRFLKLGVGVLMMGQVLAYPPPKRFAGPQSELPPMAEADIVKEKRRISMKGYAATFAELATLPPEVAWAQYGGYYQGWARKYPDVIWEASRSIAKNKAVGPWLDAQIMAEPYDEDNMTPGDHIRLLGTVPATWSARLLGKYLYDDREFKMHPEVVYGESPRAGPNPNAAANGLAQMGFWDGPTDDQMQSAEDVTSFVEVWRKWWKANESRIEDRMWEITPDYPKPASAAKSLAEQATPPPRITPKPTVKPEISSVTTASRAEASPDWVIYLGVGIAALVALLVGALLLRKKK